MYRLGFFESRRILKVCDELTHDLACLAALPSDNGFDFYASPDGLLVPGDPALSAEMKEYMALENDFLDYVNMSTRAKRSEVLDKSEIVKEAARNLVRKLRKEVPKPSTIPSEAAVNGTSKARGLRAFMESAQILRANVRNRLGTTVEDDAALAAFLQESAMREKKATADAQAIGGDLEEESKTRKESVSELDQLNVGVSSRLNSLKSKSEAAAAELERQRLEKETSALKTFSTRLQQLEDQIRLVKEEFAKAKLAHKETEESMRKRRGKGEGEVGLWIKKYDQEMDIKTTEIDALQAEINADQSKLDAVEEKLAVFAQERAEREALERKLEDEREAREAEEAKLTAAAVDIQRMWKGFAARKQLAVQKTKATEKAAGKAAKGAKKKGK